MVHVNPGLAQLGFEQPGIQGPVAQSPIELILG